MIKRPSSASERSVADYVTTRAGLAFTGAREAALRASLARAVEADSTLAILPVDDEAFARLCESLMVHESFFFREPAKFELLRKQLVGPARAQRRPVRVWSAGCAAGEEAYTLAAVLHDAGLVGGYQVVGTDLSGAAVAAAREGMYGRWALRGLDDQGVSRIFTDDGQRLRVRDHLRIGVEFFQHNLLEPLPPDVGSFDVIFCRNLFIYLTPEAVQRAASGLAAALAPGGWVVTGVADPLLDGIEGLETVVTDYGLAYRRTVEVSTRFVGTAPGPAEPLVVAPDRAPARVPISESRPLSSAGAADLVAQAAHALHRAQPRRAERLARRALVTLPRSREAHRLLVLALAQGGMLPDALEAAAAAVNAFPVDGPLNHLHALVLLESGEVAGARRAATKAVRLSPDLAEGHLLLARVHDLLGQQEDARRARRHGRQLLATEIGSR